MRITARLIHPRPKEGSVKANHKKSALNRLKTVRGHIDAVIAMVDDERYCPEVMKQVSALEASLERINRILLQNHLETCVPQAIADNRGDQIIEELLETLKYTSAVTGSAPGLAIEPTS
jgi:DNA-binding FrmR family transcriptional regulator